MTSYEISERVKYMQENGYSNKDIESWILANDKDGNYRYGDSYGYNQHNDEANYDYDDSYDDDSHDYDNGYTHSQQCYADRSDYARQLYESGRIDHIQMAEMRVGA